jgi:hypothetical protein
VLISPCHHCFHIEIIFKCSSHDKASALEIYDHRSATNSSDIVTITKLCATCTYFPTHPLIPGVRTNALATCVCLSANPPSTPFGFIHMRASVDQYPMPEIPVLPPQPTWIILMLSGTMCTHRAEHVEAHTQKKHTHTHRTASLLLLTSWDFTAVIMLCNLFIMLPRNYDKLSHFNKKKFRGATQHYVSESL